MHEFFSKHKFWFWFIKYLVNVKLPMPGWKRTSCLSSQIPLMTLHSSSYTQSSSGTNTLGSSERVFLKNSNNAMKKHEKEPHYIRRAVWRRSETMNQLFFIGVKTPLCLFCWSWTLVSYTFASISCMKIDHSKVSNEFEKSIEIFDVEMFDKHLVFNPCEWNCFTATLTPL